MINLNSGLLRDLVVAYPTRYEQERCLAILRNAQELISITQLQLDKLSSLKTGLMQDLLSGRVSVAGLLQKEGLLT